MNSKIIDKRKQSQKSNNIFNTQFLQPNPFSQDLTPWNNPSKLQASINLLKSQPEENQQESTEANNDETATNPSLQSPKFIKNNKVPPIKQVATIDSELYKETKAPQIVNRLYPKIQSVDLEKKLEKFKEKKGFNRRSREKDRRFRSNIANLTIQWDQDIVYNPERKFLEEEIIRKKVLKNFPQKKQNGSVGSISMKVNGFKARDRRTLKSELRNNKIHKNEQTVFSYNKNQGTMAPQNERKSNSFTAQLSELLVTADRSSKQKLNSSSKIVNPEKASFSVADHRKFRTSLKRRRESVKGRPQFDSVFAQTSRTKHRYGSVNEYHESAKQREIISKLTLEYNNEENGLPFQVVARNRTPMVPRQF